MFARPKINQLLANFKKKPVQTMQILFECLNFMSDSPIIIDLLSLKKVYTKTQYRYGKQITSYSYELYQSDGNLFINRIRKISDSVIFFSKLQESPANIIPYPNNIKSSKENI